MGLSAGELDRRIEVEIGTPGQDAAGDVVPDWSLLEKRWAKKREGVGREFMGSQQVIRDADTTFTLRYDTASRAYAPETHRFVYRSVIFEIVAIAEVTDGRFNGLSFLCCSRPDAGGARGRDTTSDGSP